MKKWLRAFGKGVGYIGIFLGTQFMISIIVIIAVLISLIMNMQSIPGAEQLNAVELQALLMDKVSGIAVGMTIISDILAVIIVAILFYVRHKDMKDEIDFMPINTKTIPILCLIGVSFNILISCVLDCLLGGSSIMESYNQGASILSGISVMNFIAIVLVAPLAEEIFFRGLMFGRCQKGMPIATAIALQAFFFGLIHGNPVWIAYATVVGVVLGVIAYQQESIVSTMIVHAAFNLTSFLITAFHVQIQGTGISIITIMVSAIMFSGLLVLLLKKFKVEYPQVEEPEPLELANLVVEDGILENNYNE